MKKSILIVYSLLILLFPFNNLYGQKPNTKNIRLKYVQPPSKPLKENVKLYYSEIINNAANFSISPENEKKRLKLEGYERALSIDESDVHFKFTIAGASYEATVEKVTYQDKVNDSTYVDKTGGKYVITAYLSNSVYVRDLKNDKLLASGAGKSAEKTYTSRLYGSYNDAVQDANEEKTKHAKVLYKELFDGRISYFNSTINNDYGFPLKTLKCAIARGKGKKHDYTDLQNAFELFSGSIEHYNNNGLSEEVIEGMNSCIDTWNQAIQEYQPGSKKARIGDKNIGYLYFNIAYAYFVLNEWDYVYDFLSKAKETKALKYQAEIFEETVEDLQKRSLLRNH